jgi:DNA-binding transcriptional regulator YbjK
MVTEPRQERSRVRREALLRAAIELLSEGGARAVTHRAVAARAGLPPATTTYYFDTIQELTDAALALHVADRVAELDQLVSAALGGGRSPDEVGEHLAVSLADRAADVIVAQFEIYLEAARNPALQRPVAEALAAFERFTAQALGALGARDPEAAAPAFVALVDGFALHRLARPRSRDVEITALRNALRALFVAEIMSPDDLAHWHARLRRSPSPEVSST